MTQGWKVRPLGELLKIQNGYAFDSENYASVGTQLIRIRDLKEGIKTDICYQGEYDEKYLVKKGDFLIGMDGEFGCYEWKGPPSLLNQRVCRLQNFCKSLDARYLFYGINKYLKKIEDVTEFTTVKHISSKQILAIQFPVPPLPVQRRIVAILDEAFEAISEATLCAERNLVNARELFTNYLNAVFSHKGEDWIEKALGELVEIKHGFAFKSEYFHKEGRYVLLTPGNFYEEGGYRDRGEKQKFYTGEVPDGYILSQDDFLFAMTEQAAGLLGSSIIVPEDDKFLHNQRLGLVSVKSGVSWLNNFFFHQFNTKKFRMAVHDGASGVKVRHTSPNKLGTIKVCYPPSISAQEQIATKLDDIYFESKRLEDVYKLKLAALAELRRSILHKALAGELTGLPEQILQKAVA